MSTSSTSTTTSLPVIECADALVVWVASTTVGAERMRLRSQLTKARNVFGGYAEASQHATRQLAEQVHSLAGQPDAATLILQPHEFGTTRASQLLPRGARVVGWLEVDGYRSVSHMPQPSTEWLAEARGQL